MYNFCYDNQLFLVYSAHWFMAQRRSAVVLDTLFTGDLG